MNARLNPAALLPAWEAFRQATDIGPIRDAAHYDRMSELLEALWNTTEGDESNPLWELCELVGDLVHEYEDKHHKLPEATGVDALRYLMHEHGLRQSDLPEIGSQGVVSEVLAGRRDLNIRQVKALSERFGVSPATFIG
jgi:HTH-type transcriptional regulator/antitoxin HigA